MKNYLRKLRASDHATKKRAVTIASVILTIIVVILWIAYLNYILPSQSSNAETGTQHSETTTQSDNSFLGILQRGLRVMTGDLEDHLAPVIKKGSETLPKDLPPVMNTSSTNTGDVPMPNVPLEPAPPSTP